MQCACVRLLPTCWKMPLNTRHHTDVFSFEPIQCYSPDYRSIRLTMPFWPAELIPRLFWFVFMTRAKGLHPKTLKRFLKNLYARHAHLPRRCGELVWDFL